LRCFHTQVRRLPALFLLASSTSLMPDRSQAICTYALSSASSMFASANAVSNRLTLSFSLFNSLISCGVSTRITFPRLPLPYFCTHPLTVPLPLTPYFRRTSSAVRPSRSTSLTIWSLNASLYRIAGRITRFLRISGVNLFQDGTEVLCTAFSILHYDSV